MPLLVYKKNKGDEKNLKTLFREHEKWRYSHLNLGPSILDLAGYTGASEFVANSIFAPLKKEPLYLIQPYGGSYLAVIEWPKKYIFSGYRFREWVYDLEKDPGELNTKALPEIEMERLRQVAGQIYKQQERYICE